jgi:hypothetical protein
VLFPAGDTTVIRSVGESVPAEPGGGAGAVLIVANNDC